MTNKKGRFIVLLILLLITSISIYFIVSEKNTDKPNKENTSQSTIQGSGEENFTYYTLDQIVEMYLSELFEKSPNLIESITTSSYFLGDHQELYDEIKDQELINDEITYIEDHFYVMSLYTLDKNAINQYVLEISIVDEENILKIDNIKWSRSPVDIIHFFEIPENNDELISNALMQSYLSSLMLSSSKDFAITDYRMDRTGDIETRKNLIIFDVYFSLKPTYQENIFSRVKQANDQGWIDDIFYRVLALRYNNTIYLIAMGTG